MNFSGSTLKIVYQSKAIQLPNRQNSNHKQTFTQKSKLKNWKQLQCCAQSAAQWKIIVNYKMIFLFELPFCVSFLFSNSLVLLTIWMIFLACLNSFGFFFDYFIHSCIYKFVANTMHWNLYFFSYLREVIKTVEFHRLNMKYFQV